MDTIYTQNFKASQEGHECVQEDVRQMSGDDRKERRHVLWDWRMGRTSDMARN